MSDVTLILSQIESGDAQAAEKLLPVVYSELRKLAAQKLAQEKPGQTLQATALVHEAYPMFGVASPLARRKSLFSGAPRPRRPKKCSDNVNRCLPMISRN